MLDQLVESRNHSSETRRRSGFFLSAFTIVFSILTFGLLYSLFSYNLAMANERLDISSLVSPVVSQETPPVSEKINEPKRVLEKTVDKLPIRVENIQSVNEHPIKPPDGVSTEKIKNLSRPQTAFTIGKVDSPGSYSGNSSTGRSENNGSGLTGIKPSTENSTVVETPPPPVIKKTETKPVPPTTPTTIRKTEILNGQALNLVKPPYPQPAKLVRASGAVNIQVTIDENGNVISANAVSGHPLLRQVSENAARASKFTPTLLNSQKVKVTGVIVYNFVAQ